MNTIQLISKIILFTVIFCIAVFFSVIIYMFYKGYNTSDFPAPKFSNSYALNEKVYFLKNKSKEQKVMALGSSMTLNNLHSSSVAKFFKTKSFINAASWGMNIKDNYLLLLTLQPLYRANNIIISSSIVDFHQVEKITNYQFISDFLSGPNWYQTLILFKNFELRYCIDNFEIAKKSRTVSNEYESLKFDEYGAVNFESKKFKINPNRFNNELIGENTHSEQYLYLDSIALYCKKNNINLYFFNSPFRKGIYSKLNKQKLNKLANHARKVQEIILKNNQRFINGDNIFWEDSLFVDVNHLNKLGSELFTKYCLLSKP